MVGTRRLVAEIVALHRREPTLRDIYVEGIFDKKIFDWFLSETARHGFVGVYTIETVDVPDGDVRRLGFDTGAKGRVLTLGSLLLPALEGSESVTCVVDADFDHILGTVSANPVIATTDYTSLEMYAFCDLCLSRWLTLVAGIQDQKCSTVMADLAGILTPLFAMRLANKELGWNMEWLPIRAGFPKRPKTIADFSVDLFEEKVVHKNNRHAERTRFREAARAVQGKLPKDVRHRAHGHDLVELLVEFAKVRSKAKWLTSEDAVRGSLIGTFTVQALQTHLLFRKLIARVGN